MEKSELRTKAQIYINNEKELFFKNEIKELLSKENWDELNDRFYTDLDFGTGGLRGVIGGGNNRMNNYVVSKATQGLANYINKNIKGDKSVCIAYDSRNFSEEFALVTALVLCANGIKAYLFSSLRPTPEVSYTVRELKCTSGIVITASHNPAEYNGYKVYWQDGGQIVPPHDKGIIEEVRKVESDINYIDKEEAINKDLLLYVDEILDRKYVQMIKSHSLRPFLINEKGKNIKIVFTPLHGTGAMLVERIFTELGINFITVPEQREGNGDFPTVKSPNPEEASALKMAIELAKKEKADLVMATDPDSDRLGIAVPDGDDWQIITGNQLGSLLEDYILSTLKELNSMPLNPSIVKTIVTTELQKKIADLYGVKVFNVLTGFKYIAEKIKEFEHTGHNYIFGGEESYGFLVGTEVRDKDAVSAAAMTAEMTLFNVNQGISVLDRLNKIYEQAGYFEEILISKVFKGESGQKTIKTLMEDLRINPPKEIGQLKIVKIKDYLTSSTKDTISENSSNDIDLPKSNVLQFILQEGTIVTARPSGTEPKIKFYASSGSNPGMDLNEAKKSVKEKLNKISLFVDKLIKKYE